MRDAAPDLEALDASDDDPDDPDDLDDVEDDAEDDDQDTPDDALAYIPPAKAARMVGLPLYEFRRLVESGRGPAIARFMTGQGGWRVRRDVLQQWFHWQQFLEEWQARRAA